MKKLFALTLAVLMVVSMFPLAAIIGSAETLTSNVATVVYQKDGVETELGTYNSIDLAMEAMRELYVGPLADETIVDGPDADGTLANELYAAAGSPVIKLNGDFAGAYARPNWATGNGSAMIPYDPDKIVTFVIDGQGATMTFGTESSPYNSEIFNYLAFYNLTVKNTNFVINRGTLTRDNYFLWQGNASDADIADGPQAPVYTVFENCNITEQSTRTANTYDAGLFKLNGERKAISDIDNDGMYDDTFTTDEFNLTFKDCVINSCSSVGVQVHWGADSNIALYNTTWTTNECYGGGNNNDAIIKYYESGNSTFYMDGTSKLIDRKTSGSTSVALIRELANIGGVSRRYEFENGAELIIGNTASSVAEATFIAHSPEGSLLYHTDKNTPAVVIDHGAKFIVEAESVKSGMKVNLPKVGNSAGLLLNGSAYNGGYTYNAASATADLTFTNVLTAPIVISNKDGSPAKLASTIDEAFNWVYNQANSQDYTIYLNADVSTANYLRPSSYNYKNVRTVRIEGNGHTLTSTNGTAVFYGIGLYNLKLSNLNIVASSNNSLDWSPRLHTSDSYGNYIATGSNPVVDTYAEFRNVTLVPAAGKNAGVFKFKGGNAGAKNLGAYNVDLINCEFTSNMVDTMVMMNDQGRLNLNIIGTTLTYLDGFDDNTGNNHMFQLGGSDATITVKNSATKTARLYANPDSTHAKSGIFFPNNNSAVHSFVLGSGVELVLGANASKTNVYFFGNEKVANITDNGAKYIVEASALANGATATLPALGNSVTYLKNGETFSGYTYADAEATDDVVFTSVVASPVVVYNNYTGGATSYSTIQAAFKWVYDQTNSADYTIWLTDDITNSTIAYPDDYNNTAIKTINFNGNGHTITTSTTVFHAIGLYNLNVENVNVVGSAAQPFDWSPCINNNTGTYARFDEGTYTTATELMKDSHATFTNVNVSTTGNITFKLKGGSDNVANTGIYYITLTNCVLTNTGSDTMFMMNCGANADLTLEGTTLNYNKGGSNTNAYMFAMTNSSIKVDAKSHNGVVSAFNVAGVNTTQNGIFAPNAANIPSNLYASFGAGTTVTFNGKGKTQSIVNWNSQTNSNKYQSTSTVKVYDNGMTVTATKAALLAATTGIDLSNFSNASWKVGSTALTNNLYTNTSATGDATFTNGGNTTVYVETANGNRTYYATIDAAVDALGALYDAVTDTTLTDDGLWKTAGSPIVYVSKNISLAATAESAHVIPSWYKDAYNKHGSAVRTVYIKGVDATDENNYQKPLITYTGAGSFIRYNGFYNVTLEDIDLNCTNGFALFHSGYIGGTYAPKSTSNMINCGITATGTSGEGLVFKVTGNYQDGESEYVMNFINTDVAALGKDSSGSKGVNATFLFHHGAAGTVNIDGASSFYHKMDRNSDGGDTMFMFGTYRYLNLNIDNGAYFETDLYLTKEHAYKVINIQNVDGCGSNNSAYVNETYKKSIINIADGATFKINTPADSTFAKPAYIVANYYNISQYKRPVEINIGKNVNYIVDAKTAANGFGVEYGNVYESTVNTDNLLGYLVTTVDGTTALYGKTIAAGKLNKNIVSVIPVYYADGDFTMQAGAALRTVLGQSGIRFTNQVANSLVNKLADATSVTYGTIIANNELLSGDITLDTLEATETVGEATVNVAVGTVHANGRTEGNYLVNRAALIGVPDTADAYQKQFAARAYFTVTYADGTNATFYTNFNADDNVRSMYDVATALDGSDKITAEQQKAITAVINTVTGTAA